MTAIRRYILHLVALILLVQGVHAGCISGDISGEPLLFTDPESLSGSTPESLNETVMARMAALPLSFIPNEGQTDPAVRFMVKGSGTSFSFTNTGMLFSMQPSPNETQVVITQNYIEASESARVSGEDLLPGTANYFIGSDPENWRSNIPTYGAVRYHDLYPGIDLLYTGNGSVLKREFIVAPGSDPSLIWMELEGADSLLIDESGSLNIIAGAGTMTESGPVCFQEIEGTRVDVGARYVLSEGNELTIAVDAYDPAYELVIDPELEYSTYLGGSDQDFGNGIAVDSSGNAYVTGFTSGNFPTKDGARPHKGGADAFVTKLNAEGSGLVYSTYLGGGGYDEGRGIAVDSSGNAYVTGCAGEGFPTTDGAYQPAKGGGWSDAFVTKLNAEGSGLVYSTYLGGSETDVGYGIAVDSSGNAFVTGDTMSSDFPTKDGAYQKEYGGSYHDAFVTKLNAEGSELVYSTYLGGSGDDYGRGIAVDGSGNAYVTGQTTGDFPTKDGAYQREFKGNTDVFVTKLNAAGSGLVYSTYLGGLGSDQGNGIAVDGSGNAYVTGCAGEGFPTTVGAYQTEFKGNTDVFVTKLNAAASELLYSTYLGGLSQDRGHGIAVDGSGNAYVTGCAGEGFPTTVGAYQTEFKGNTDVFVTKLNTAGSELLYSTYLGGLSQDRGHGIAVDGSGNAYVTGSAGVGFPTTDGAYQTEYGEMDDAFVTKFSLPNPHTITSISPSTGVNTGPVSVAITGTNFAEGENTVRLTRSGQTAITATDVNRVSETNITCTLPITGAAAGDWNVELTTANQTVTMENGFTVTAPAPSSPTITSISPSTGVNTGPVSVTITGTNFAEGENTVRLTRSGQTAITATDVNRVSETNITCTLPITGAAAGDWNVELTTANQTVTMENGFTVTAPAPSSPTITSISPSTGYNTGRLTTTITGTNFRPGVTAHLTRGATRINGVVSAVTGTRFNAAFPLLGAPSGVYTLTVTNTDRTSVTGTFTVRAEQYSPFKRWGRPGSANNQFRSQKGIAVDRNGFIYVADTLNHRVVKYNQNGRFLTKWGTRGAARGKFLNPADIAVDRNNNVYVADTGNHRIQKFNPNGRFLRTWGTRGAGNRQLNSPSGIGVDTKGNVYVADTNNHRIVKFNPNGVFLKKWGARGSGNGRFISPRDVAVDNRGFIYVADTGNHRIQKLRPTGAFLTKWGQTGAANGRFRLPSSIDVDSNNFVYVADTNNHRIQKFSNTGAFLTKWGVAGNGPRQLRAPPGLAVNAAGLVYVADTGNHRVSVWRKPAGSLSVESVEEGTPVPTVVKSFETPDVSRPVAAVPVVEMPVRAGHDIRPLSPAVVPQSPAPAGIGHGGIPENPLA